MAKMQDEAIFSDSQKKPVKHGLFWIKQTKSDSRFQDAAQFDGGVFRFDFIDGSQFVRQTVQRLFVDLAFAVRLVGLGLGTVQVAHDFRNGDGVARIDFRFVFLSAAAPHRPFGFGFSAQCFQRRVHNGTVGQFS